MTSVASTRSRNSMLSLSLLTLASGAIAVDGVDYGYRSAERHQSGDRDRYATETPDSTNFTDLRISLTKISTNREYQSASDAPQTWASASRVSIMSYGPVCSVIPINCFTPSRVSRDKQPPSIIAWGESHGWDMMGGLELTMTSMKRGENTTLSTADVKYKNYGVNWHTLGLGTEFACVNGVRVHIEANPYIGTGFTQLKRSKQSAVAFSENVSGMSFEFGARLGIFLTAPFGLQVGGELRYIYNHSYLSDGDNLKNAEANISSASFGLSAGYRF